MKTLAAVLLCGVILSACVRARSTAVNVRCLEEDLPNSQVYPPMGEARLMAAARGFRLPRVSPEEIVFERDPRVCSRISQALGRVSRDRSIPGRTRPEFADVLVIRFGNGGYYVQSMWHDSSAGEFHCHAFLFDATLKQRSNLCG